MAKNTIKFRVLHDDFADALEYLATYGIDDLNDIDQKYATKLLRLCSEYIEVYEELNLNDPETEDEE